MNILDRIVQSKRREVDALRAAGYYQAIATVSPVESVASMAESIRLSPTGIIAEFKRRSPSRGLINGTADVERIVEGYASEGAAACSVLTDTPFSEEHPPIWQEQAVWQGVVGCRFCAKIS